jgi:hypothetical protein
MEYKDRCEFQNLPSGQYVFKVRTKFANSLQGHTAVYSFTVLKPWYRSTVALFFYLIGIVLARIIDKAYRSYYQKKEDKLIQENNRLLKLRNLKMDAK